MSVTLSSDSSMASKDLADIQHAKSRLRAIIDIRDLQEAKCFLGMGTDSHTQDMARRPEEDRVS